MKDIEIVINTRYGGFGLSIQAVKRMAELDHDGAKQYLEKYKQCLSDYNSHYHEVIRWDPILVKVVREMGKEAAGGSTELAIAKIDPKIFFDDLIDEHDGLERVPLAHDVEHFDE